jgi:hypothetical protein
MEYSFSPHGMQEFILNSSVFKQEHAKNYPQDAKLPERVFTYMFRSSEYKRLSQGLKRAGLSAVVDHYPSDVFSLFENKQDAVSLFNRYGIYEAGSAPDGVDILDLREQDVCSVGCGNPNGHAYTNFSSENSLETFSPLLVTTLAHTGCRVFGIDYGLQIMRDGLDGYQYPFFAIDPYIQSTRKITAAQVTQSGEVLPRQSPASLAQIFESPFIGPNGTYSRLRRGQVGVLLCTSVLGDRATALVTKEESLVIQAELQELALSYLSPGGLLITDIFNERLQFPEHVYYRHDGKNLQVLPPMS